MSPSLLNRLVAPLVLLGLLTPAPVGAAGPDYGVPGRFALPWACGQGHRITWDAAGHWAHGKATGVAFDFAMDEGNPLFAPADGVAYFLEDERPLDTNLGNCVELVVARDWLVRLAHLRDPQSGERRVRAGELVGYSGSSGVSTPHLHLEVLVRGDRGWVRPDLSHMERFFGRPVADFVEDAIITNDGCSAQLALEGAVRPVQEVTQLGETVDLVVPLRNEGLEPTVLNVVQVALCAPSGAQLVAEERGEWRLDGKGACSVVVRAHPNLAGRWRVEQVTCQAEGASFGILADGALEVAPSAIKLVGVTCAPTLEVGAPLVLEAWVENPGDQDLVLGDIRAGGIRPGGAPWSASVGHQVAVSAGGVVRRDLVSSTVPQNVGRWRITQIGFDQDDHLFVFARLDQGFGVVGRALVVERLTAYASPNTLDVFLIIANVGTQSVAPDGVEAWGWKPDGEHCFNLVNGDITPLAPGESALVQLVTAHDGAEGIWRLVEVGYWTHGRYYRMSLPDQTAIVVDRSVLAGAVPR